MDTSGLDQSVNKSLLLIKTEINKTFYSQKIVFNVKIQLYIFKIYSILLLDKYYKKIMIIKTVLRLFF